MSQIVILPVDEVEESAMYKDLLNGGFSLSELKSSLFIKLHDLLNEVFENRNVFFWGVPSGLKSTMANKWVRIQDNDRVLFTKNGHSVATAIVKMKFQSQSVADNLWPGISTHEPRQYLLSLDFFTLIDQKTINTIDLLSAKGKQNLRDFQIIEDYLANEYLILLNEEINILSHSSNSKNFGLNSSEKKVIEKHAVAMAIEFLKSLGFTQVHDVGDFESFDLLAKSNTSTLKVEVKGTTGLAEAIVLTRNEVNLQLNAYPDNALIVVKNILLDRVDNVSASQGEIMFISPWKINEENLTPISFNYQL